MKRAILLALSALTICSANSIDQNQMATPIPDSIAYDKEKAILGKKLYMDTSLSADGKVSCNTCHDIKSFGVDNQVFSTGIHGVLDKPFNSPTTFNAVFNFVQFWNGRAKDLADQARGPFTNPNEMGLRDEAEVIKIIEQNPDYKARFNDIYGEINMENITDAIAEFEKTLITPNSPFDRYQKGDQNAISDAAKRGWNAFKNNGCIACHQGQNLGGTMYQKIGIFEPYPNQENLGRYEITKQETDKMVFKVPSLRNIAKTAPYYHDGSVPTLDACVQFMAYYQLGRFLDQQTVDDIVAFLESLTGEYNEQF
ncbi:cytochrome-c peroxidase [Campylobacter sp. CX2-8023-23]|uniref:Cytochrome-c peroxidase n=1 Tax=Campylobacter porcelli TaxID=1660073 RepID=A0ABU7M605_9BACT|nr:cytochrome-c peroxidase [Campylobacter sp. CX2-8023-23]MEE3745149.1 cytochrome-c peroxidase [Campylobacter sp. CX2-4855-23]MEE3777386.1 cytochrome-c peroxidase [Campylobacter sp. CX2-4080-23]